MSVIRGHIESIVNVPNIPPSLVVVMRDPLGTYRIECVIGKNTGIARDFERLRLDEIRPGEFVEIAFREHAGWLEAERIDVIRFPIESDIGVREEKLPTNARDCG